MSNLLNSALSHFEPELIIFDKDGTLIDYRTMWFRWMEDLAQNLENALGIDIAAHLFELLGYDPEQRQLVPGGPMATQIAMADIQIACVQALVQAGVADKPAHVAVEQVWNLPDPVTLARPLADLNALFRALRSRGIRLAVATGDDRIPTEATLAALGVAELLDGLICADDPVLAKPAPDMIIALCSSLDVRLERTLVVGDTLADMHMAKSANVGWTVGVLSGVAAAEVLAPYADALIPNVAALMQLVGQAAVG